MGVWVEPVRIQPILARNWITGSGEALGSQQVDLQFLVAVLACPKVQRDGCQFVHHRNRQPHFCQVDGLQVRVARVANIYPHVRDLRSRVERYLRLSFLAACRTVDSSERLLVPAQHANQGLLCPVAFRPQDTNDGLGAAQRTR